MVYGSKSEYNIVELTNTSFFLIIFGRTGCLNLCMVRVCSDQNLMLNTEWKKRQRRRTWP